MDDEQEFDAPEDDNIAGGDEAEVPEDDEASDDADSDDADDADEQEDDEQGDEEPQPKSRASNRIRTLATREKAAKERAEKAERDVAELRRKMEEVQNSIQGRSSVNDAAAEAALLAEMDPVQRVAYEADKKINGIMAELNRVKMSNADSADRADFLAKYSNEKDLARLAPEVEKMLKAMRATGYNAPREEVLSFLIGREYLEKRSKSGGKSPERQAAQARVSSAKGRPSSGRSDAGSSNRKGKTAEERLENVQL